MGERVRLRAVVACVLLAFGGGCGGDEPSHPSGGERVTTTQASATAAREEGRDLEHDGISVELPQGWNGRVLALDYPVAVLQAANFEFAPPGVELPPGEEDPIKAMSAAHALVMISRCGIVGYEEPPRPAPARLSLDALRFLPHGHPRLPAGHAFAHGSFDFSGRCLRVEADFGSDAPDRALAAQVDAVLGSLLVGAGVLPQSFEDSEAGLAGPLPEGWHVIRTQLTAVVFPRQVLALASFPLRQSTPDPGCIPATAREQLPAGGAVVVFLDYGDAPEPVAAEFPARPQRFRLPSEPEPYECYGLGHAVRFSESGRQLQAQVLLGEEAGPARRAELAEILDGLRIGRVP
jgi:hypothetical protein